VKRLSYVLLAALVGGMAAGSVRGAETANILQAQKLAAAEYELAKQPSFYFVLDVRRKTIELRVRGMALRTWKVASFRYWGLPSLSGTVSLVKKSALKPPQRNVIKPGEAEKKAAEPGKFELEALELKDMPTRFSLDFDNGLHVSVATSGKARETGLQKVRTAWHWYVKLPLKNLSMSRKGKAVSELEFTFADDRDAQALYWIFFEGIKGLVY
jgi:hypothetical protein